jgi:hypothetical protein
LLLSFVKLLTVQFSAFVIIAPWIGFSYFTDVHQLRLKVVLAIYAGVVVAAAALAARFWLCDEPKKLSLPYLISLAGRSADAFLRDYMPVLRLWRFWILILFSPALYVLFILGSFVFFPWAVISFAIGWYSKRCSSHRLREFLAHACPTDEPIALKANNVAELLLWVQKEPDKVLPTVHSVRSILRLTGSDKPCSRSNSVSAPLVVHLRAREAAENDRGVNEPRGHADFLSKPFWLQFKELLASLFNERKGSKRELINELIGIMEQRRRAGSETQDLAQVTLLN